MKRKEVQLFLDYLKKIAYHLKCGDELYEIDIIHEYKSVDFLLLVKKVYRDEGEAYVTLLGVIFNFLSNDKWDRLSDSQKDFIVGATSGYFNCEFEKRISSM